MIELRQQSRANRVALQAARWRKNYFNKELVDRLEEQYNKPSTYEVVDDDYPVNTGLTDRERN